MPLFKPSSRLLSLFSLLIAGMLLLSGAAWAKRLPNLNPNQQQEWLDKPAKSYLLLDFYSETCGTCRQLEPYYQAIQKEMATAVHFTRVNLDDDSTEAISEQFNVGGTPTYILFNAQGEPIYRMQNFISVPVLMTQLKRYTRQLPVADYAGKLPAAGESHFRLLAVEPDDCKTCQAALPYLNAISLGFDGQDGAMPAIDVVKIKPQDPGWQAVTGGRPAGKHPQPFYVLLDPENHELYRQMGGLNPQQMWRAIHMLTSDGLSDTAPPAADF